MKRIIIPKCHWHKTKEMEYLQFFADAEERHNRGEKQKQCPVCRYWFWPYEYGVDPVSKILTNDHKD